MTEEKKKLSSGAKWVMGCSLAFVLMACSCLGLGWWLFEAGPAYLVQQLDGWLSEVIEESHIPEDQAAAMHADLDRVRVAFDEGRLGIQDLEKLDGLEEEMERLVVLGIIQWFDASQIPAVDLPEDEMLEARMTVQRLGRAVQEGQLHRAEGASAINIQIEKKGGEDLDAEDVRIIVRKTREIVDELEIPVEPYVIDVAREFRGFVDGILE